MKLERDFYLRSGLELARDLMGKRLVHNSPEGRTAGIIVEVEAYMGVEDAASHAYRGRRTERTAIQYGVGGHLYTYTIYGVHTCMNIVANREGCPETVFIRALEPCGGLDLMRKRRQRDSVRDLCNGPGKVCQAMGIDKTHHGLDVCGDIVFVEDPGGPEPPVVATERINIAHAGEAARHPWRFVLWRNRHVSVPPRCRKPARCCEVSPEGRGESFPQAAAGEKTGRKAS